jgi:amino acid transporter
MRVSPQPDFGLSRERIRFGTVKGVLLPSVLTALGVVLFLRATLVVGIAGIDRAVLILGLGLLLMSLTAMSLSAVASSMKVKGGGAYFLLSRTFGASLGGGIGLGLFLAETIEIAFYILGLTESMALLNPSLAAWRLPLSLLAYLAMFSLAWLGASRIVGAQVSILGIVLVSILFFLAGSFERFSWATFEANRTALYHGSGASMTWSHDFWTLFAIYFPGLTGVLAGMGLSGDLQNPGRNLSRGTFAAILLCGVIYLAQILLCGGSNDRLSLIAFPFPVLQSHAWLGAGFLVTWGAVVSIVSSAITAILVAPRVLQAVARDRLLPALDSFDQGIGPTDEPRHALAACAAIVLVILLWANLFGRGDGLSLVAQTMSMVFLWTYGMINLAAFLQGVSGNPSFRPHLTFFHWSLSLIGMLGCFSVTFLIYPTAALAAGFLLSLLVWLVHRRALKVAFGDVRRGFLFAAVREQLLQLQYYPEDRRNWRPTILVMAGEPLSRERLLNFAEWFEAGCGVVYFACVLIGMPEEQGRLRQKALQEMRQFCLENRRSAFPVVACCESFERGVAAALQMAGSGAIAPNLVLFGCPSTRSGWLRMVDFLRQAASHGLSSVLVNTRRFPDGDRTRRIDIWWRGRENGDLMLLLAHLTSRTPDWRGAIIRVRRQVTRPGDRDFAHRDLESLIDGASIDATAEVIVEPRDFLAALREKAFATDLSLFGMELPPPGDEDIWIERQTALLAIVPECVLVHSVTVSS